MSTERWDDERLDRLADLIESNARAAERHERILESNSRMIEALTQASAEAREERQQLFEKAKNYDHLIESNARVIQALANAAAEAGEERRQLFQRMDQRQEEIRRLQEETRGLQTENRRILDILLNQQNQQDDATDD
jgi:chromosome segregation ATPase